jgi:hypothetical protein
MITEQKYLSVSLAIGCNVAAVMAVAEVESGGNGFFQSGKIKIKFEGHVFHQYTKGRFDESHPHLSYQKWTEAYSEFGEAAYSRFNQAFDLDPLAAMLATSWGKFQIMGYNYALCGFKSIHEFVTALKISEDNQLGAFCTYILKRKLHVYLIDRRWNLFAYYYNGSQYRKNQYDIKLANAYAKFIKLIKI